MKRLLLAAFALLFVQIALAQSDKKSFISLSAGPSIPIGDFKLNDITDERAGLAETGTFINLSLGYRFSPYVGGMVLFKGKIHGIEYSGYNLPDGSGRSISIETTTWRAIAGMAGLFAAVPLDRNDRFDLRIKGLAGVQQTYTPELEIVIRSPNTMSIARQYSTWGYGFAYLIGTDLQYNFNKTIGLMLTIDYNSSNARFNKISTMSDGTIDRISHQVTSTLDTGLGLVVAF